MLAFCLTLLEDEDDRLTFTKIYEQLMYSCLHVAMMITKDKFLAEDAVQDAFISVIKHKDEIFCLPCGKRKSKIVIITKNKAIDIMRLESKRTSESIYEADDEDFVDDFDLTLHIENEESYKRIIDCIAKLPELYKTAFELRYVHDMSNAEIAKLLGSSPKAIHMRVARARQMLREILEREGIPYG